MKARERTERHERGDVDKGADVEEQPWDALKEVAGTACRFIEASEAADAALAASPASANGREHGRVRARAAVCHDPGGTSGAPLFVRGGIRSVPRGRSAFGGGHRVNVVVVVVLALDTSGCQHAAKIRQR